jgi:hypothetical protein
VWREVAELISNPVVQANDAEYTLEVVCGSDYKYLLLMMGLNNATSIHACLWCTVTKDNRWDMSVAEEQYNCPPPHGKARTLAALTDNSRHSQPKKHLGSKNPPILPLEPASLILDELHLLLRIGDVLIRNLILQADTIDHVARMAGGRETESHLRTLEHLFRRCGVSFRVAPVVNENNRPVSGLFTWTVPTRRDKLRVLHNLPRHLSELLAEPDATQIGTLWKVLWRFTKTSHLTVNHLMKSTSRLSSGSPTTLPWVDWRGTRRRT